MSPRHLLLIPAIVGVACSKEDPAKGLSPVMGVVEVCTELEANDDTLFEHSGVVVAVDDGASDCARSVTIEASDGTRHTVGWTVTDDTGGDQSPAVAVEVGMDLTLGVRSTMVFGVVRGLILTDADGLVFAADEGTWGGGLRPEETGVVVEHGPIVAVSESDCVTTEYSKAWLEGDATYGLDALVPIEVEVDGQPITAMLVASIEYGPGTSCSVSDKTDELAWVAWR
jgi:hypothetical protein